MVYCNGILQSGLFRPAIKGKGLMMISILSIQMLPGIMMAMPLYIMFSKVHLSDRYAGIRHTCRTIPWRIWGWP